MNPIDFNLKAKSFKIKGLNMLGNSPESKKFISYNNEERKNYYKNVIPKPTESTDLYKTNSSNVLNLNMIDSQIIPKKIISHSSKKVKLESKISESKKSPKNLNITENKEGKRKNNGLIENSGKDSSFHFNNVTKNITTKKLNLGNEENLDGHNIFNDYPKQSKNQNGKIQYIGNDDIESVNFNRKPLGELNLNAFLQKKSMEKEMSPSPKTSNIDQTQGDNSNIPSFNLNITRKNPKISESDKRRLTTIITPDKFSLENLRQKMKENIELEALLEDIDENKPEEIIPGRYSLDNQLMNVQKNNVKRITNGFNRMKFIKSFFSKSQAGKDETGNTKINQDSFLVSQRILKLENFSIFGVFDGHGNNGHLVSGGINRFFNHFFSNFDNYNNYSSRLPNRNNPSANKKESRLGMRHNNSVDLKSIKEEFIYDKLKENNYELLRKAFQDAENELINSNFDVNLSGSTSVLVLIVKDKIICANVGDSRAILLGNGIKNTTDGLRYSIRNKNSKINFNIKNLSNDHKPNIAEEKKRIESMGGRVAKFVTKPFDMDYDQDSFSPYRVWLKDANYPGLAMSRSIGDMIAAKVGVTCMPEIIEFEINNDKYIVIASDGVWEFLDNEKVCSIVNPFYEKNDPEGACEAIIKESTERWQKEEIIIDDITVVIIFMYC